MKYTYPNIEYVLDLLEEAYDAIPDTEVYDELFDSLENVLNPYIEFKMKQLNETNGE